MADNYLDQIANRALQQVCNQAQAELDDYQRAVAAGDADGAATAARQYRALAGEYQQLTGQAQQPQQVQQQFSPVEQQILREFPGVASDPKKWNEALAAANALVMRGYDRNSAEYDSALRIGLGLANADGSDGNEIASPQTALDAINNSQIARRFGAVDADTYNRGVQRLVENKKLGLYEPK